ncbi:MAG: DUF6377 domain-containing protein [Prevotella sp.]|nr:DUF6377 domain-containing protein [Prevotella sp.]
MKALCQQLDEAISQTDRYVRQHEERITQLKQQYASSVHPAQKYRLALMLFEKYRSYVNDSAQTYLRASAGWAARMGRRDLQGECLSRMAFQCSTIGLYNDAVEILSSIDRSRLSHQGLVAYYGSWHHVYFNMGVYTSVPSLKSAYERKAVLYRDSLFSVVSHWSPDYYMPAITWAIKERRLKEADQLSRQWLHGADSLSRDYAVIAYYRSTVLDAMGKKAEGTLWLARSAVGDVTHAVMDQASLWSLATRMDSSGGIERQYSYISFSWQCALRFGTRVRSYQIFPSLKAIEGSYKQKIAHRNLMLVAAVIAVSLLALALLLMFFYVNRQRRRLLEVQGLQRRTNERLEELNHELRLSNLRLDESNQTMKQVNAQLCESNRVKEEYIGRFLGFCSLYVDKLERLRRMANRMVRHHQFDELLRLTQSSEQKSEDLSILYHNFDEAFMHLFPTFVDDFNQLLQPAFRIEPPKNELNITLRIFALIRLGIDDSSKIAEFLNYSVNTIYNYRSRIKNGAICNRTDFEKQVRNLGGERIG